MKLYEILNEERAPEIFELFHNILKLVARATGIEDNYKQNRKDPYLYHVYALEGKRGLFFGIHIRKNKIVIGTVWDGQSLEGFPNHQNFPGIKYNPKGFFNVKAYVTVDITPEKLDLADEFIQIAYDLYENRPMKRGRSERTTSARSRITREDVKEQITNYYYQIRNTLPPQVVQALRANRENMIRNILAQKPKTQEEVAQLVSDLFSQYNY